MNISIVIVQVVVSIVAMCVTASSSNLMFLSLTGIHFHKIDQKTFKGIVSGLYFTTLVNILPKLRYFVGRICIQIFDKHLPSPFILLSYLSILSFLSYPFYLFYRLLCNDQVNKSFFK